MNTELIRLKTISTSLGLSTTTLRRMIKRKEIEGVLIGGNYYIRPNDYYKFLCNIECKKYAITQEQMRKLLEEVKREKNEKLLKLMGFDNLDKATKDFINAGMLI